MQKVKKNKKGLIAMLCAGLLACVFAVIAPLTAYGWEFHGINMSDEDKVELYFMEITVSELWSPKGSSQGVPVGSVASGDGFNRVNKELTLFFQFPNFTFNDKVTGENKMVFIPRNVTLNCPNFSAVGLGRWLGWHFVDVPNNKLTISLSNNYYKYIRDVLPDTKNHADTSYPDGEYQTNDVIFKDFYIKAWYGNSIYQFGGEAKGQKNGLFNNTIRLYTKEVSSGVFNPLDKNFDPNAGNNGDNTTTNDSNSYKDKENENPVDFWQWLANLFGQPVSAIITIAIIIAVIIGVIFLIKFLKWAFK